MKLTEHFTLEELTKSETAKKQCINNAPDLTAACFLALLAALVLEPARVKFGKPIRVSNAYRSEALNNILVKTSNAAKNSQHLKGQAADLYTDDPKDLPALFAILKEGDFDQLLFEHNKDGKRWIHVSYNPNGNRRMIRDNYAA